MAPMRTTSGFMRRGIGVVWSLLWPFLLTLCLAILITALVRQFFGDFDQFKAWGEKHYGLLLGWRLLIYAAIGTYWINLRGRLLQPGEADTSTARQRRCEILAALVVCLFELKHAGLLVGVGSP